VPKAREGDECPSGPAGLWKGMVRSGQVRLGLVRLGKGNRGTVASVVIQVIGSGTNEETLMKATHPMIRLGQFGACIKLV